MEAQRREENVNRGQTKAVLTGRWSCMSVQEIAADYQQRLSEADSWMEAINRNLLQVAAELRANSKPPV